MSEHTFRDEWEEILNANVFSVFQIPTAIQRWFVFPYAAEL